MELPDNFYDELYIGLNYFCRHYRDGKPIESDEYEDEYDDFIQFGDGYCAEVSLDVVVICEFQDDSFDHEFGTWDDPAKGYYPSGVKVDKIRSIKVYDEDDNEIPFTYDRERIEELELTLN